MIQYPSKHGKKANCRRGKSASPTSFDGSEQRRLFEGAFKEATRASSDALVLMESPFFFSNQKQIVDLAGKISGCW